MATPERGGWKMKLNRRAWLKSLLYGGPAAGVVDATVLEPDWLKVTTHRIGSRALGKRIVQITDIHYKGDTDFLKSVVARVNRVEPDAVCFTGDLIEDAQHLEAALSILGSIQAPIYGIPGNHDHWSGADLNRCAQVFKSQGGGWIPNQAVDLFEGRLRLVGGETMSQLPGLSPAAFNLLMVHYPEFADHTQGRRFDLILAGHTHGGQVRLPWVGALVTPFATGGYEMGWFETSGGPLYVNPGIGYFYLNVRFRCRPEIAVFEI